MCSENFRLAAKRHNQFMTIKMLLEMQMKSAGLRGAGCGPTNKKDKQ